MGRISMFCGVENYVLRYKSVYYKVITDYVERIQYSVFSFFRCCCRSCSRPIHSSWQMACSSSSLAVDSLRCCS